MNKFKKKMKNNHQKVNKRKKKMRKIINHTLKNIQSAQRQSPKAQWVSKTNNKFVLQNNVKRARDQIQNKAVIR